MSQDSVTRNVVARMRAERRRRGWSTEQMEHHVRRATGVHLPRTIITNLENNRRDYFAIEEIVAVAKVFGTTVNWLVWGTGVACQACNDRPPAGFTCNDCGRSTAVRVADVLDQSDFFHQYVFGTR